MVLYLNCCIREESRTDFMARKLLAGLGDYEEVYLPDEELSVLDLESMMKRNDLLEEGKLDDHMFDRARQFAQADEIVIAAPFWDLSFPALLKLYIENIYVTGIVSEYGPDGRPRGLCRASKLYYVTTAGGPYDGRFSFDYIKTLAQSYFGIGEVRLIMAEMLDVEGFDADEIIKTQLGKYGLGD